MLSHIPLELQEEIIRRLPVKSVLRCRSVSKAWKSLTESPEFIAAHTLRNPQPQHRLLAEYKDPEASRRYYVSFVDDDSFPKTKVNMTLPKSVLLHLNRCSRVVGSSHGLFCLTSCKTATVEVVVLWNPSIGKSVAIDVPEAFRPGWCDAIGFGVCPNTLDPKVVVFGLCPLPRTPLRKVEVYSLSSAKWRSVSINGPGMSIAVKRIQVATGRCVYWMASDFSRPGNRRVILSFDMTDDSFGVVSLPNGFTLSSPLSCSMFKIRESLAVVDYGEHTMASEGHAVWMMADAVEKTFTKLYNIKLPPSPMGIRIQAFRKNGEPIVETYDRHGSRFQSRALVDGEPNSEHSHNLEIDAPKELVLVASYVETLLLLGCHLTHDTK